MEIRDKKQKTFQYHFNLYSIQRLTGPKTSENQIKIDRGVADAKSNPLIFPRT